MSTPATWNTTSGNWFSAANWDEPNPDAPPPLLHHVPGADEDASLPDNSGIGTPFTVSYNGTSTINTINGSIVGTLNMTGGSLTLLHGGGFNSMAINVGAGATLNIADDALVVTSGNYAGTIAGAGELIFTYGTFNLNAGVSVTVSDWLLGVTSNGTVSTTNLNTNLTYANNFTLGDYSGNHAVLNLGGHTLTLSGTANIDGTINGPGTVLVTGSAEQGTTGNGSPVVIGGAVLEYASGSTGTQHLHTSLGDATTTGTLKIDTGALYTIDASAILGNSIPATAIVTNAGTLKVSGAAVSATLNAQFTNTGTLTVDSGDTLSFGIGAIGTASTLGGIINGAGTLWLNGATALNSSNVTIGTLHVGTSANVTLGNNLTYANTFTYDGQFANFSLNGHTLTLGGSSILSAGNLVGAGTLRVTGTADIASFSVGGPNGTGDAATIRNSGTTTQSGFLALHGTLLNDAGRSYTITTASDIIDQGGAVITNSGTFTDSAAGVSRVSGTFTNTGTLSVGAGATLVLNGGMETLGGVISGAGNLTLGFGSNATLNTANVTVSALSLNGGNGGASLTLGTNLTYAGAFSFANQFDMLDLNGRTLTLSGASNSLLGNIIDGAGTLRVTGSATIGNNIAIGVFGSATTPATIRNSGSMTQTGSISLNGTLLNDAGRTYTIASAGEINNFGATITNNGTFIDKAAGISGISGTFTSSGVLSVAAGATLILHSTSTLGGTISGAGALVLGSGSTTAINTANVTVASLALSGGIFAGTTTLGVDLTYGGAFTLDSAFATLDLNGHALTLTGATSLLGGTIDGKDGVKDTLVINGANTNLSALAFTNWTAGVDTITLNGTGGNDQLGGSSQSDTALGGVGADTISGNAANDKLFGEDGNDVLNGGAGADYLSGGAGSDFASYAGASSGIAASLANPAINTGDAAGDTYNSVENLIGSGFDDTLNGTNAVNDIRGDAGIDAIKGYDGNDKLYGQDGNDTLIGGVGADYLSGGAGSDTASYAGAASKVIVSLANPAINSGDAAGDTYNSIENLIGTSFDDALNGASGANIINGGAGNDSIKGYAGNDTLTGGAGSDFFIFNTALDAATNVDTITDYNVAADTIQLDNSIFTVLPVGPLAASAFKDVAVAAKDANDRILYNSDTGNLYYDQDGSGSVFGAIKFATLTGHPTLTAADFVVI
ncbi:beta strand repeat-containing protein [Mesorhizobium sp. IMUNJ 23232]|uniref:beta strand repeat-containing protein n=1 Tax=Mesorhizobium sp. IMUNJ 23232 TaxID=3376064 RepID=UPI0037B51FD8